ncbi:hypothetical protein PHMEG_00024465 [Phytophthora megakarya]|uniref:Uncharacterized protein n=1 Tax=Phytophthora megakarya TaxID=4795 RepID=A0A225VFW0_9STRA|nr:hypothetical protein PHMEG_00024465 [Phytophthora megakarya]
MDLLPSLNKLIIDCRSSLSCVGLLQHLPFAEKGKHLFRLSLWSKTKRALDTIDIADIQDGEEIYVERVTGLKLFVTSQQSAKLAEGNANRVEVVTKVCSDDSDGEDVSSQGTDSESPLNESKHRHVAYTTGNP